MNYPVTIATLLLSCTCFAQIEKGSAVLERVEVVETLGTAPDLYRKAERWMVDAFRDSQEAIELRDTTTHTLVAKGYRTLHYSMGKGISAVYGTVPFTFTVEVGCKEGRYRIRIYNAQYNTQWGAMPVELKDTCYAASPSDTGPKATRMMAVEMRDQFCTQIMDTLRGLEASLKAAMLKPKDEW